MQNKQIQTDVDFIRAFRKAARNQDRESLLKDFPTFGKLSLQEVFSVKLKAEGVAVTILDQLAGLIVPVLTEEPRTRAMLLEGVAEGAQKEMLIKHWRAVVTRMKDTSQVRIMEFDRLWLFSKVEGRKARKA